MSDKGNRREFSDALNEARLRGDIPAHVVLAGWPPKKPKSRWWIVLEWAAAIAVLAAFLSRHEWAGGPGCKIQALKTESDVFMVDGQPDAGFTVHTTIANTGSQGEIRIKAVLETSEGTFRREQTLTFPEKATRTLDFGFPEPTINATNVQGVISCGSP